MKAKRKEEVHIYSLQEFGFNVTEGLVGGCIYCCDNRDFRVLCLDGLYYAEYHGQTIYEPLNNIAHLQLLYRMLFRKQLRRKPSLMLNVLK